MRRLFCFLIAPIALIACQGQTDWMPSEGNRMTADAAQSKSDARTPYVAASRDDIPHAQLPETLIPESYVIDMVIDPKADTMSGRVVIEADLKPDTDGFWMHAKDMTIQEASLSIGPGLLSLAPEMIPLSDAPSGLVWMQLPQTHPGGSVTLTIDYLTPFNRNLNSAYKVERGDDAYIVTQMEPLGAREAFPGLDEPKYKQPFTLSITAPAGNVVVSNTPKTSETPLDDGRVRHQFAKTLPLPTYLIAFAVGPYDVVDFGDIPPNDIRDRPLVFRGLAAKGEGPRLQYALENTDSLLTALERYFGQEYPYEKLDLIAAPDYAFGTMENPGLIVYREYLLLLDDNAPLAQKRAYARVHSHELAHQWFGNLVTPVWWEDIWLNEAFATWMGNKGLTLWRPEGNFDNVTLNASLGAMNIDTLASTRAVREPLERSENVMDQFDGITYRKGGGVLDMFEAFVGPENFQAGVRLHMDRYRHDVATADDFFQSIADGSGNANVVNAMKSFVDQPGLPLLSVAREGGALMIEQSRYAPLGSTVRQGQTWEIPVVMKIGYGDDIETVRYLVTDEKWIVDDIFEARKPDWIMPNLDGAGYYRFTLPSPLWAALINNLDKLTTKEALVAQDSLVAAFRAGDVEAETFLSGMKAFAQHPEYDVASGSTRLLGFIHEHVPDARKGLAEHVRSAYGARYRATRGQDSVEGELLAPVLGNLLAVYGNDPDAKNYLLRQGTLLLGLGVLEQDEDKRAQVPTNIYSSALRETMRRVPAAAMPALLERVKTGSPLEKSAALSALAQTPDPEQADKLRELILSENSPFTGRQTGTVIAGLLGNERHREATWDWYRENFEAYVSTNIPDVRRGGTPGVAGVFCSDDRRTEVRKFFTENADLIPGYERSLAQTLERIALCSALKSEMGPKLRAALTR